MVRAKVLKYILFKFVMIIPILIMSCSGGTMPEKKNTFKSLKELPDTTWEALSKKKFYFGHQSVGYNILDGIKDLQKDYPRLKLNIVETTNPDDFSKGILAHSKVGENFKPHSKINDFFKNIDQGIGKTADAAR